MIVTEPAKSRQAAVAAPNVSLFLTLQARPRRPKKTPAETVCECRWRSLRGITAYQVERTSPRRGASLTSSFF